MLATGVTGDRYVDADEAFAWADVVHAEELSYWFAADAARRKAQNDYKLVLTVWETIPFLDVYRNRHARTYRARDAGGDRPVPAGDGARAPGAAARRGRAGADEVVLPGNRRGALLVCAAPGSAAGTST